MPISITKYVDITSGVGAAAAFGTRELIARLFTTNPLVATGTVVTFDSAAEVLDYFGSASEEYARAVMYFGWISKAINRPSRIAFARWADEATAPLIYGAKGAQAVGDYTGITAGTFSLTLGGVTNTVGPMNFSAAVSLANVATIVQTAIIAAGTGAMWDSATVAWNSTRQSFDFTGGATGAANIVVAAGSPDVAGLLGWLSATAILSDGSAVQTISDLLTDSTEADNNFGSFTFLPTLSSDEILEAAEWNDTQNNRYLYSVRCTSSTASALSAALIDISGNTLTLAPISTEYPEQIPMMIEAATDYTERNAVQNYMFQTSFDLTPSVTTNADYETYTALRVNFYGSVQQAGVIRSFYQRGVMMGGLSDATDQNVYVNEIWFKDAATVAFMNLLLALPQIPANSAGRGMILNQLQSVIDLALYNGVIEAGKALTNEQKLYIATVTGDKNAYITVQNEGYWVDARIVPYDNDGVTEYKAVYTLIYSKNDVIRLVQGSDILI